MEIDANFKNQDKHWILVILGKVKNLFLLILRYLIIVFKRLRLFVQKFWKVLIGIAALIIIIAAGIWGYDYYKNTYIPKKLLNEAVSDIKTKFETYEDKEKALLAYHILQIDYAFEYDNVQDREIRKEIATLYEPAFKFIENKAFNGNARCQSMLANLYYWGNNYVEQNNEKSAYWFNESANQGYSGSYNNLGICYRDGIGVPKDIQMAIKWLRKGAEAGEMYAQKNYGDLFLEGVWIKVGSHKETRQTADFYQGSKDNVVKTYYDFNTGKRITIYQVDVDDFEQLIPKDIEQAKYWWKKAAAQGHQPAIDALQKIY